jgi:hypothetical protein
VDTALNYVFSKDRDFQGFLRTPQAKQVASTLRVQRREQWGVGATGEEASSGGGADDFGASGGGVIRLSFRGGAKTVLRTGRIVTLHS